jgi:hypothetical protein
MGDPEILRQEVVEPDHGGDGDPHLLLSGNQALISDGGRQQGRDGCSSRVPWTHTRGHDETLRQDERGGSERRFSGEEGMSITKEDLERLFEQLTKDPKKVFITNEDFKLLSSVMTVWRPDLMQEFVALTNEVEESSKVDSPAIFAARVLKLMKKYSGLIGKITEEIELRKEYYYDDRFRHGLRKYSKLRKEEKK